MQAPLDARALQRVLDPFGRSRLLPREAYTSPEVLEWERRRFFEAAWVCAGRAGALAEPGDQRAVRVGRDGVLLVRGEDGSCRGFYNVCRHRAHELLEAGEPRRARSIRCPYHGWTYGLDGGLNPATRTSHAPGFDPAAEGLVPARVEVWRGWVFVNASGDAPPLADWLGDLEPVALRYEPERLRVGARHEYEVACNWKLVAENYHECYHCPQIHPELCRVSPPDSGKNPRPHGACVGGTMKLAPGAETMSMDGRSLGVPLRGLSGDWLREVHYYGLFPDLLLSFHPDYVMTHRIQPLAPDRSRIECEWLFPPEAFAKPGFDPGYAVEFWDVTNRQDWRAVESVQRGVESRGYVPGTLTPREDAVHQFLTRVALGYLEGRFDPEPRPVPAGQ